MTATTAVPSYRRLARLTPYLLAAGLAIIAWLLLGSHAAFAEERTGSGSHRPHLAEATEQGPHHEHPIAPKANGGASAVPAVHAGQQPTSLAATGHPHSSGHTVGHPAEPEGPPPVRAAAPPPAPVLPAHAARQQGAPIAPAQPRHVEQRAWSSQPPVAATVRQTAAPAPVHRPAEAEESPPVRAAAPPPPVRPAAVLAAGPKTAGAAPTRHQGGANLTVHSLASQHPVLVASVQRWAPAHEEEVSASEDEPETVRSFSPPAAQTIAPQPATQPAAHATGAPRSTPGAGCAPVAILSFHKAVGARSAAPAQSQPESGVPAPAASAPLDLPPLTLVAEPSLPAAPEPQGIAPVAAAGPPAPTPLPPVTNPVPLPGLTSPSRGDVLDGSPLVARLQSALTLIALGLLVALLAIVLLVQMRLMRLMRSLQAAPEADEPAKRYYSLSHEEVRELAPDLTVALTHHRFCESERHQGRHRLASWLELEQASTELPLMWSTCETCHHQRITRLQTGREVAAAHN